MLDGLDKELAARGHSFVRYADDVSIYVGSEKSATRTLETISSYVTKELKLKVNGEKSKVSRPEQSTLLGFSFYRKNDKWEIRIAPKSLKRIKEKLRAATSRKDPTKVAEKIKKIEAVIAGWVNYFRIARAKTIMQALDGMVRHRLRMGIWKQWKTPQTRLKNLRKLGVSKSQYYHWGASSLNYCRIANNLTMKRAVSNIVLQQAGYIGFYNQYYWKTEHQTKLF